MLGDKSFKNPIEDARVVTSGRLERVEVFPTRQVMIGGWECYVHAPVTLAFRVWRDGRKMNKIWLNNEGGFNIFPPTYSKWWWLFPFKCMNINKSRVKTLELALNLIVLRNKGKKIVNKDWHCLQNKLKNK